MDFNLMINVVLGEQKIYTEKDYYNSIDYLVWKKQSDALLADLEAETETAEEVTTAQDYIGLDKTIVSNITVEAIDFEKLTQDNNTRIYTTDSKGVVAFIPDSQTGEIVQFSSIKIEDNNLFGTFNIGSTLTKDGVVLFTHLTTYVDRQDGDYNYKPYSLEEFKSNLYKIQDYIQTRYGISLDVSTATFLELEMNQNILIPKAFREYERVLTFMTQSASKRYKKNYFKSGKNVYTGFALTNKSYKLKCYDKKTDLRQKRHIEVPETMRFEITIKNESKKSKANFEKLIGTNKIFDITQEQINSMFYDLMDSILIKNMNKERQTANKKIIKLAKKFDSAKDFIEHIYKVETGSMTIVLFSASQLSTTSFYDEALPLLPQNELTAEDDLNNILNYLVA